MTQLPHDLADLYLAPVALKLDGRPDELARLTAHDLGRHVALASKEADWTVEMRRDAVLRTVAHAWICTTGPSRGTTAESAFRTTSTRL